MDWSSVGYSYLEVRIFSSKTSNVISLSISTLFRRSLWRIDTIFCLFEKAVWSPISVNWLSPPSQISSHVCKTNFSYTMRPCSICRLKKRKEKEILHLWGFVFEFCRRYKKKKNWKRWIMSFRFPCCTTDCVFCFLSQDFVYLIVGFKSLSYELQEEKLVYDVFAMFGKLQHWDRNMK